MFGSREIDLTPVDPVGFVALADVKTALGIADTSQDARLTALIAAASAMIERYCARPIGIRSIVERVHAEDSVGVVVLSHFPASLLGVVAFGEEVQTLADFRLSGTTATVRRNDGALFPPGEMRFEYAAGYATTPPAVAEACSKLVQTLYNATAGPVGVKSEAVPDVASVTYGDSGSNRNGVSLPYSVSGLLAPYVTEFQP